jgi:hypothetical protein
MKCGFTRFPLIPFLTWLIATRIKKRRAGARESELAIYYRKWHPYPIIVIGWATFPRRGSGMGFMHRNIIGDFRTNAASDLLIESDIRSLPRTGESEMGSPCPESEEEYMV